MTDPAYQRVKDLFARLVALPPRERHECRGDQALAEQVTRLLANHDPGDDFLSQPALGRDFSVAAAFAEVDRLEAGPWRTMAVLGSGASSIVYRAEHAESGRLAALKVLRPGAADPAAHERFVHEAGVLQQLHHPGIATVLDAGLAELHDAVTPWLAMELVAGPTLRQWAAQRRPGVAEVLAMVARIADAVQYAHEHGVVHNDLKPDNVLVADGHLAKVVDFGLAQSLQHTDPHPGTTAHAAGSLGYVSPERLLRPTHASVGGDVYALGAIAYELLTGRPPLAWHRGLPHAIDHAAHTEAWPLSALQPELGPDLETVVHHALASDPRHRCPSAGFFAAELRRCLAGEPIRSPRPGLWRRFRRLAAQHRTAVAGAVATFVAMLLGITATGLALAKVTAARADEARQRARAEQHLAAATIEQQRAQEVTAFLTDLLRAPLDSVSGERAGLETAFVDAARQLELAAPDSGALQPEICHALGMSLLGFGRYDLAVTQLELALRLHRARAPDDIQNHIRLQLDIGITLLHSGRPTAALHQLGQTAAAIAALPSPSPLVWLRCQFHQALAAHDSGDEALAQRLVDEGLPRLAGIEPERPLVTAFRGLGGRLASARGDHAAAAAIYDACVQASIAHQGAAHPQTFELQNNLALELLMVGEHERGAQVMQQAFDGRRQHFGEDHPETLQSLHNLASLRKRQNRLDEALELTRRVASGRARLLGPTHPKTLATQNNLARLLEQQGDRAGAETMYRDVLAHCEATLPAGHGQTTIVRRNLGAMLQDSGRPDDALPLLRQSLLEARARRGDDHPQVTDLRARLERIEAGR
jgi:tRNA A-37 threonylcarbamoyl transferase component Bud32/tetratricopeptide (TPR) repeat protein